MGMGLIGGSIGLALRRAGIEVTGYDRSREAAEQATIRGAATTTVEGLTNACSAGDLVVIATPVGQIVPAVTEIARTAPDGVIVTDTGSVKEPIASEAERILGAHRPFVGGHPMAGTEGEGIEAARVDLFDDALWFLTPTPSTDAAAYRRVNALVTTTGARTLAMDPSEHDRLVALVSHLPYTLATVLMVLAHRTEPERAFRVAAGSFRDMTRTAGSNPTIWEDILTSNRSAILGALDSLLSELQGFREALDAEDWRAVGDVITSALEARRSFPWKGARGPTAPVTIEVPVPDRAGVLAELTTALGEGGVNIEDIWMDHTPSGGVVYFVVDGSDVAEQARLWLSERGFRPTILEDR